MVLCQCRKVPFTMNGTAVAGTNSTATVVGWSENENTNRHKYCMLIYLFSGKLYRVVLCRCRKIPFTMNGTAVADTNSTATVVGWSENEKARRHRYCMLIYLFSGKLYRVVLCRCRKVPITTNGTTVADTNGAAPGVSGSDSEDHVTKVKAVTYRFQVMRNKVYTNYHNHWCCTDC